MNESSEFSALLQTGVVESQDSPVVAVSLLVSAALVLGTVRSSRELLGISCSPGSKAELRGFVETISVHVF